MNLETTDLEQLAQRWAQIKDHINTLQEEEDEIKTKVSQLGVGTHPAGAWKIQVQAPRRTLNKKRFQEAFPVETFPSMYSRQLDTKAVKQQLAPATLEQYMDTASSPVVTLK